MAAGDLPKTISVPGELPPDRFSDYNEVTTVCYQMVQADMRRAVWRTEYEKVWGGNPTYSIESLREANQSWRARANYRGMEGLIAAEQTLDYDLETQVENIIDIDLDYGKGQEQRDWEDCIEKEFTWLIRCRWGGFNFHVPFRIFQKNLHGMGAHIWPGVSGNWIPRTPRAGHVLFPDGAPFNFSEDGEYFCLRDWMPSNVLYRHIANEKEARELGWRPDAVWKALSYTSKSSGTTNTNANGYPIEETQRMIRRGDIGYTASRQSGVWINTVFVREYETGKISQYSVAGGVEAGDYLFVKRNRFESFDDILCTFPIDIGDGTMQGIKGYGARTKVFFELNNRIRNAMADQVMLGAYPNYKQVQPNLDPDKMKLSRVGGMNISPYGLDEAISKYPPLDNGPLALLNDLKQTMQENTRGGIGGYQQEQADRGTAQEYAMRGMDSAKLNNGSVELQRSCLRQFYQKMLFAACEESSGNTPAAKMAKEFRDRMFKKGVPKEALKHIAEVRAILNAGKGSASAQLHALMTLRGTVYQTTSADRQIAMDRDLVATLAGYNNVDRYARSVNDNDMPDNDDSFIVLENDALTNGGSALAAPKQDHVKHLQGHLGKGAEIVQALQQQQIDPQAAYAAIHAIGQHCGETELSNGAVQHGHLFYLQGNPTKKAEFWQLYNEWQALGAIADKLAADIKSSQDGQQPEEKISDQLKIGLAGVQAKSQVQMAKTQADEARKMRQQQFSQRLDLLKTGHDIRRNSLKTAAEISHSTARTSADIQLSAADTAAAIARDRAKSKATNGKKP